jgi:SAM-dependent methyltransferase
MSTDRPPQGTDYFSSGAAAYARHRPSYPPELVDFLAELAPARTLAWDAGCGSGQLSVLLAGAFDAVAATDVSAEQLARAAVHPRVRYRQAPAEASGLPAANVDAGVTLAVAAQAAHWFDLPAYWAEVRRVARPGAGVALVAYGHATVDAAVDQAVHHLYETVLGAYWPPERRHVESGYRTLDFPFREVAAPELAIVRWWTRDALAGYVATWSALEVLGRRAGGAAREAALADLHQRLAVAWPDGATPRLVQWQLAIRAGRVGETRAAG